LTKPRRQRC
jgi:hypothetical protein